MNPADYPSRYINNLKDKENLENLIFSINKNLSNDNVKNEQFKEKKLFAIIQQIKQNIRNKYNKKYDLNTDGILILENTNKHEQPELLIAPKILIPEIIMEAHKSHFGFRKTYENIKSLFYWQGMYKEIKKACINCIPCGTSKAHQTCKVPIQKITKEEVPGTIIQIDICGRLPVSINKFSYILTIVESTSRYIELIPLKNIDSQTIIKSLNEYFGRFGYANVIICDNASNFKSKVFQNYCNALGIELRYISVYKPSGQGIVECPHRTLKTSLIAMSQQTFEWDVRLAFFKLCYNTSINRATGYSPSTIFFAREIKNNFTTHKKLPNIETHQYVQNIMQHATQVYKQSRKNQEKLMSEYDKINKNRKDITLQIGQIVYTKAVLQPRSLERKFEGLFKIIKRCRNNNYILHELNQNKPRRIRRHISHIYAPQLISENELIE